MVSSAASVGRRIQRLRVTNGLSQADFALATGIATGVVSMLENGRQAPDDAIVVAAARELHCTADYLTRPDRDVVASRPWLRAYADASKRAVDRYIADTETAVEAFETCRLKLIPESIPGYDDDLNNDDAIEEFASHVRQAAGLAEGAVVGNCIRSAERLGIIVLPMDDELGRHMGMSLRVNATPVIRASRPHAAEGGATSPSGDRQRFTVAHEIGHLALHAATPPPATAAESGMVERQAHRFAGAFLAPAEPLLADLDDLGGRITLSTLQQLKERWGVAIKMLVVRLRQLERIDDHHARSLYKQISARRWNRAEPVSVGHESAIWLERALAKAYGPDAGMAAGSAVGLQRSYFDRWAEWGVRSPEGQADSGVVVSLAERSTAVKRRNPSPGSRR